MNRTTTALLCVLLGAPALGDEPLDTVVVQGRRAELAALRQQILQLEDRFYDRFNELNRNPEFDVHCSREARTGTLMKKRGCRAVYEDRALQEEGAQAFQYRQHIQDQATKAFAPRMPGGRPPDPTTMGGPPVPAQLKIELRRPEFRKNLLEVTQGDAELQRLLREKAEAEQRYVIVRKSLFQQKSP